VGHCEGWWDAKNKIRILKPDVKAMQACVEARTLTDVQWVLALQHTGAIRWRSRWPAAVALAVSMRSPAWMGPGRITLEPRIRGWNAARVGEVFYGHCGTYAMQRARSARYQPLGPLPLDVREVVFDVVVERGHSWQERLTGRNSADGSPQHPFVERAEDPVVWRGVIQLPVEAVHTIDEAVPPATSRELDRAVGLALGAGFRWWHFDGQRARTAFLVLDPDADLFPELADMGLSLEVDVLQDGARVETVHLLGSDLDSLLASNSTSRSCGRLYASANLRSVPASAEGEASELSRYELRVKGTSQDVLLIWSAETRWDGDIVVPLEVALEQETARVGVRGPEFSTPRSR
jgi:hypothetical protein